MPLRRIARLWLGLSFTFGSLSAHAEGPGAPVPQTTSLPPVMAPLPASTTPAETTSESPTRRDPTGAVSVVAVPDTVAEAKELAEVLGQAPGVVVQDVGGLGQSKAVELRGASSNATLVYLDGIPLNGAGAIADLSKLPAGSFERIEVLRGAAGALYGSGGLGGVVNLVSRAPAPGTHAWAEATYGSFQSALAQLGGSTTWSTGSALVLLDGLSSAGNFPYSYDPFLALPGNALDLRHRINNDATEGSALIRLKQALGSWSSELLLEGGGLSRGLAGSVDLPQLSARQRNDREVVGARVERTWDSGVDLTLRGFGRREHDGFVKIPFAPDAWQVQWVNGLAADASWLVGHGTQGLSASLELQSEALHESTGVNPSRYSLGALVQDEILLAAGRVSVSPAFRVDQVGNITGVSPKLGARWTVGRGFELKANAGQAFRAPSFLELYVAQGALVPNPKLLPERALYLDGALSHTTRTTQLSVGGFSTVYENLIAYEYYPPFRARPYNFATAQVSGLEAEGHFSPAPWLHLRASYTFQKSVDLRDEERFYLKALPNHPEHRLFARVDAGPAALSGHAEALYQSAQFENRTNTVALPGRAFVNAGLSSAVLHWFAHPATQLEPQVSVEVKNLFDAQAQDYDGYPLPGRAVYASVRVAWDAPSLSISHPL